MDIQTVIIIALFFLIFIVPFWLLVRAHKAKEKKFIHHFNEVGRQHQLQFTEQESWHGKAIGVDARHKKVLYLDNKLPQLGELVIDLNQMSGCKLWKQGEVKQGLPTRDSKIELRFTPKQITNAAPALLFFDMNVDDPMQINTAQERAKAWLQRIEVCMQQA